MGSDPYRNGPASEASFPAAADASCLTGAAVERDASFQSPSDASRPGLIRRVCAWCEQPIPERARRDAICCSVRCRQARHRFTRAVGHARSVAPGTLRLAYADPPYPGNARLYLDHADYAGEVDHAALIRRLTSYDGWALSTSSEALPAMLALCPTGIRVAAWHRGERPGPNRWPLRAWEPVIYSGGRQLIRRAIERRRVDSLVCGVAAVTTRPGRVIGAKPAAFCRWIFDLLGAAPGDTLDDLFPGSGTVTRAWATFTDPSTQARAATRRPQVLTDASARGLHDASRPTSEPE
jgi:hypothetical protein